MKMKLFPHITINMMIVGAQFILGGAVHSGSFPGWAHGIMFDIAFIHFIWVIIIQHNFCQFSGFSQNCLGFRNCNVNFIEIAVILRNIIPAKFSMKNRRYHFSKNAKNCENHRKSAYLLFIKLL